MVDKRKGMPTAKVDIEVNVSKQMVEDHAGIYVIKYKVEWGRDGLYAIGTTVYCHRQHDHSVESILSSNGLHNKSIKRITLYAEKQVGDSVAVTKPIKRWRITNEI